MAVYLDHNATTFVLPKVIHYVNDFLAQNIPCNPSSLHKNGQYASHLLENSRYSILQSICGEDYENYNLIFTGSCTEANNQVLRTFAGKNIFFCSSNHKSSVEIAKILNGVPIPVEKSGNIDFDTLENLLAQKNIINSDNSKKFNLISVDIANGETGVLQDGEKIATIAKKYNALLHYDISQAIGKVDILKTLPSLSDYITFSSHKIGGLHGIGALIYKKTAPLPLPLILGGGQEFGLRSGTNSVLLAKCFSIATKEVIKNVESYVAHISNLQNKMEQFIQYHGGIVIAHDSKRLSNTSSIAMLSKDRQIQLPRLDLAGFMLSAGSACSSGRTEVSNTLVAMGLDEKIVNTTIRVSLGIQNTQEEVEMFCHQWNIIRESQCN